MPKVQPSGAANRKAAKTRAELEAENQRKRGEAGFDPVELLRIEAPPEDVTQLVSWAQRLQAKALHAAMLDPVMTFEAKINYVKEASKSIGQAQSRVSIESKIRKLEEKNGVAVGQHDDDGLEEDPEK